MEYDKNTQNIVKYCVVVKIRNTTAYEMFSDMMVCCALTL